MMYCLRTYIPLLLLPLPLSLSPVHLTTLLILTYILNRPCIYCSFLLLVLFGSSCAWQGGRCFWSVDTDFLYGTSNETAAASVINENLGWAAYFLPRLYTTPPQAQLQSYSTTNETAMTAFLAEVTGHTITGLASAAKGTGATLIDELKKKVMGTGAEAVIEAGTQSMANSANGIGTQWLKNLLGRSEWMLPCIGVRLVL
jgi:Bladder cancer-related protein BC10